MRDANKHKDLILGRVKKNGCVLMLDFDGTLASIVANYRKAAISPKLRSVLASIAKQMPVAVISGRSLADIRNRVCVGGISYAGSHGIETFMARSRKSNSFIIPARTMSVFQRAKHKLAKVAARYPRVRIEDKGMSYAVHYRSLSPNQVVSFVNEAREIIAENHRDGVSAINDLYTFDIMPNISRTKGHCAREMFRALRKHNAAIPVYIGDGLTDENAFRMLHGGITIRVGKMPSSAARYYFKSRIDVDKFLRSLQMFTAPKTR